MQEIIPLNEVIYDERARNGVWCCLPYPNHPRGCPNFPKCTKERLNYRELPARQWYAIIEEFDLLEHAKRMKSKHPLWSERQCRNVLYWQNSVRSRLRKKAEKFAVPLLGDIILDIPEACGVNVFATMAKHGLFLKANPDYVYKIMLVGKNQSPLRKATDDEKS